MINCYVIEDEPLAMAKIKEYIAKVPYLQLVGSASNPLEIAGGFAELDVGLVFSDILMPGIKGTEFLRAMRNPPAFIFISADPGFALEGFELDVVDYILKPYGFDRFLKAVLKAKDRLRPDTPEPKQGGEGRIMVKVKGRMKVIWHRDILYIEGAKDYANIVTAEGRFLHHGSMVKLLDDELPPDAFTRTQRSYIVNKAHIASIGTSDILMDNGEKIKLGETFRDAFYLWFGI